MQGFALCGWRWGCKVGVPEAGFGQETVDSQPAAFSGRFTGCRAMWFLNRYKPERRVLCKLPVDIGQKPANGTALGVGAAHEASFPLA